MRYVSLLWALVVAALGLSWLGGCGGGGGADTGQVTLLVGDAPMRLEAAEVTAVNVTIARVELRSGDEEGATVVTLFDDSASPQAVNLLSLANKPLAELLNLGTVEVPAGHYSQLRLYLTDENSIVLADTSEYPLIVPSSMQSGLKINLDLDITAESANTVLVDFNLSRFVQENGNGGYRMSPTAVRVAKTSETGNISGIVTLAPGDAPASSVNVTISVPVGDSVEPVTTAVEIAPGQTTGQFLLNGIPAGTYDVTISTAYAEQPAVETTITGVQVAVGITTDLNSIELPSVMP